MFCDVIINAEIRSTPFQLAQYGVSIYGFRPFLLFVSPFRLSEAVLPDMG